MTVPGEEVPPVDLPPAGPWVWQQQAQPRGGHGHRPQGLQVAHLLQQEARSRSRRLIRSYPPAPGGPACSLELVPPGARRRSSSPVLALPAPAPAGPPAAHRPGGRREGCHPLWATGTANGAGQSHPYSSLSPLCYSLMVAAPQCSGSYPLVQAAPQQ